MRDPIIKLAPRRMTGQHPGLLLTRFLTTAVAGDKGDPAEKHALLAAACAAGRDPSLLALYRRAFDRWREGLSGVALDLRTPAHTRLIVGLGNKGVVEAGLRLHHTYGVPLIPGSALKGVTAHYCHEILGPVEAKYRRGQDYHNLLFGTTDDSGVIRFEDAWMHPDSLAGEGLLPDVMTPHHQKWQTEENTPPSDFDNPVPVPFLSVAGRFLVALGWSGPDHPQASAWTQRALELLKAALAEWGVGGKTSSGYGHLVEASAKGPAMPTARAMAAPVGKRPHGTPTKVTIVAPRAKGGYDVKEEGRPQGTLTLGTPPAGVSLEPGGVIDVLVHTDDARKPQYKWPEPPSQKKPR